MAAEACIACNATSVTELALLLGLAFPGRNPGETRVFDCNKRGPCGDTALMLACRAGLLVLATMLKDAGANVSVANDQGDTPLLDSEFWPGLSLSLCRERERERARSSP